MQEAKVKQLTLVYSSARSSPYNCQRHNLKGPYNLYQLYNVKDYSHRIWWLIAKCILLMMLELGDKQVDKIQELVCNQFLSSKISCASSNDMASQSTINELIETYIHSSSGSLSQMLIDLFKKLLFRRIVAQNKYMKTSRSMIASQHLHKKLTSASLWGYCMLAQQISSGAYVLTHDVQKCTPAQQISETSFMTHAEPTLWDVYCN